MMVDATLFLWSKCKPHFQRVMSPSLENCKQLLTDVFANRVRYQIIIAQASLFVPMIFCVILIIIIIIAFAPQIL